MKKLSIFAGILATLMIAGYSLHLTAGPNHKGHHGFSNMHEQHARGMTEKRIMHHLSHLDLSEQQEIDIRALVKEGIVASKVKREEIKALHMQLRGVRQSDSVDEQAIRTYSADIASLKSDLMIMHLNKRKEVAALLTDEQKSKMEKMKAEYMSED